MITPIDLIGHFGYALVFFGTIALAFKKTYGWFLRILGAIVWIIIGIYLSLSSIWFWESAFIIVDCIGLLIWTSKGKWNVHKR